MLSLLLVAAVGAGIGLSELSRQQGDRDAANRRGSELTLGAVQLDGDASSKTVSLRVQVQNRGPEPVRLVDVTVAGTRLRADPGKARDSLLAGGDRTVTLEAPVGCTEEGASLEVPERIVLTVTAETSRGGRRVVQVRATAPSSLSLYGFGNLSRSGLDRLCGLVPPEQALQALQVAQPYTANQPDTGGQPDQGVPAGGGNAVRVLLENVSRLPQRLLGVDTPLGETTVLHNGVPLALPATLPAGGATTGTFPLGGATPPDTFTYPVTVVIRCGSSRVTGPSTTLYVSFDAGPGTARQQTNVQGNFGRC